jgi:hypothetical protein
MTLACASSLTRSSQPPMTQPGSSLRKLLGEPTTSKSLSRMEHVLVIPDFRSQATKPFVQP